MKVTRHPQRSQHHSTAQIDPTASLCRSARRSSYSVPASIRTRRHGPSGCGKGSPRGRRFSDAHAADLEYRRSPTEERGEPDEAGAISATTGICVTCTYQLVADLSAPPADQGISDNTTARSGARSASRHREGHARKSRTIPRRLALLSLTDSGPTTTDKNAAQRICRNGESKIHVQHPSPPRYLEQGSMRRQREPPKMFTAAMKMPGKPRNRDHTRGGADSIIAPRMMNHGDRGLGHAISAC